MHLKDKESNTVLSLYVEIVIIPSYHAQCTLGLEGTVYNVFCPMSLFPCSVLQVQSSAVSHSTKRGYKVLCFLKTWLEEGRKS